MPTSLEALQPRAQRRWSRTDTILHRLSKAHRLERSPLDPAKDGFAALVQSIAHQQVSLGAGRAIHGRVVHLVGGDVTAAAVARATPDELRAAGLSRSKASYVLDLAQKSLRGEIDFRRFARMTDEQVVEELVKVKGIGTWTAKMFLIFHLRRPDVFVPEDLGLRIAVAQFYGVPEARVLRKMTAMRDAWSPFNSVAARVLWQARRRTA